MFQTVALSGSRGERLLFSDVSVTVKPGTLLAVVGENGSGKTSFLRMLCGLLSPDCGAILWQGKDIRQLKELYCAQLTYVGHLNGIKDELTPVENLKVSACLAGDESSGAIVQKSLEAVGRAIGSSSADEGTITRTKAPRGAGASLAFHASVMASG
jgi:heme exporter protein A